MWKQKDELASWIRVKGANFGALFWNFALNHQAALPGGGGGCAGGSLLRRWRCYCKWQSNQNMVFVAHLGFWKLKVLIFMKFELGSFEPISGLPV